MKKRSRSKIRVDFHLHSNYSDGVFKPEILAEQLARAGVRFAALVDHDSTAGLESFKQAVVKRGIGYVSGVEMTLIMGAKEVHILGYGFDPDAPLFKDTLTDIRRKHEISLPVLWRDIKDWWSRTFWKFPRYTFTETLPVAPEELPYLLTDYSSSDIDYPIWFVGEGVPSYLQPRMIEVTEGINQIHHAGGLAFLAHPLALDRDPIHLDRMVADLRDLGLDGLEGFYSPYSREQRQGLVALAERYKLLLSSGSDYHGFEHRGATRVGIDMPSEWWDRFRRALNLQLPKY